MLPSAVRTLLALVLGASAVPCGMAQQTDGAALVPEWQIAAGGKMAFEVASVKPSQGGEFRPPNFPLDTGDTFANMRTGELPRGRFSARFPLITYITFAYKIWPAPEQRRAMVAHLPSWVTSDTFEIEARAPTSDATKDQMRLMMQSLLAERFHLAAHREEHTVPVLALALAKPGKLGPKLLPHEKGPPCDVKDAFPPVCDAYVATIQANGIMRVGSRNTTMDLIAAFIPTSGEISRPVVDRTGLSGRFDFQLECMRETNNAGPAGPTPVGPLPNDSQSSGPTFLEALNDQLGLKLEAAKAPIPVLVIDHVERPSEN